MRTLAIIGQDRCGSTILARMLDRVPGLASAGEVHWLVDAPPHRPLATRIRGWHISRRCMRHGASCPVFDEPFITQRFPEGDLYAIVAKRLGCDTLVSADKSPQHFERFTERGQPFGVILYKRPQRAIYSHMVGEAKTFEEALEAWHRFYALAIRWAPQWCKEYVALSYEDIVRSPGWSVYAITRMLGAPRTEIPLALPDEYHFIGGNRNAHLWGRISEDRRWEKNLAAHLQAQADKDPRTKRILRHLEPLRRESLHGWRRAQEEADATGRDDRDPDHATD